MKNTDIKIIIIGLIITILLMWIYQNNKIEQARAELAKKEIQLQEAKIPSEIEIQKANLIKLEEQWRKTDEAIYKLQALKPRIESKIQNLRKEIISTWKKEEIKK